MVKISKDVIIIIDENLNVSEYVDDSKDDDDDSDDTPTYDVFESQYTKTGNTYYYEPDLSGFNPEATYYVTYDENGQNETIYGRIDKVEKPTSGWHDYENKLWANVVTVTESDVTYWTWVPRYKYTADSKTSTVGFVNLQNKCIMSTETGDEEIDTSSYELPESFKFGEKDLKGYWVSKYEIQLSETSGIEQLKAKINGQSIELTTSNPSGEYTIYLNGTVYKEHVSLDTTFKIENLSPKKIYDVCVYSETNQRMVGRRKKMVNSVITVDTSGFEKSKTYYVVYDEAGNENIAGRMDKISEPAQWYNYENKVWANLVTVNEDNVTYWTYIPRYEYDADGLYNDNKIADVKFITTKQTTADFGYTIPESFTFNGEAIPGYWVSKYEVQLSETSGIEKIQTKTTSSEIELTTSNPSGTYTIYLNGEVKEKNVSLPYKIKGLNSSTKYDICVFSEASNRFIGAKNSETAVDETIKVDLSGFNPEFTYYVTYDENGENEQIGDKIKLDSEGNATNMPENWYNYYNKRWANIVTKGTDASGNELISYWTYIPRYEYDIDGIYNDNRIADVKFIKQDKVEADYGYIIPESFTFNGVPLAGYWVSKYEVQGTID